MDRIPESPWNPKVPVEITPAEFETFVLEWLDRAAAADQQTIDAKHLGVIEGQGGEYKIDVLITLQAFVGAEFIVLVECKHQRRPVEREDAMILHAKVRDVGAHKGILFSTSGFQSGALEYSKTHGLATVSVVDGKWLYMTRAKNSAPVEPPPWVRIDRFVGIWISKIPTGVACHTIENRRVDALIEWLCKRRNSSSATPGRRSAEGFAQFDVVRVRQAMPEHRLTGGEEGTIVEILDRPDRAYLVDFSDGSADPADPDLPVLALTADQLTLVRPPRPD